MRCQNPGSYNTIPQSYGRAWDPQGDVPETLCAYRQHLKLAWPGAVGLLLFLQGACAGSVPAPLAEKIAGAPLQPLAEGQCLLLTDVGGLRTTGEGNVWIDSLYIRAVYTSRTPAHDQSLLSTGEFSTSTAGSKMVNVYLTRLKLQGDNVFERSGVVQSVLGLAVSAPTYMSGVVRTARNSQSSLV